MMLFNFFLRCFHLYFAKTRTCQVCSLECLFLWLNESLLYYWELCQTCCSRKCSYIFIHTHLYVKKFKNNRKYTKIFLIFCFREKTTLPFKFYFCLFQLESDVFAKTTMALLNEHISNVTENKDIVQNKIKKISILDVFWGNLLN